MYKCSRGCGKEVADPKAAGWTKDDFGDVELDVWSCPDCQAIAATTARGNVAPPPPVAAVEVLDGPVTCTASGCGRVSATNTPGSEGWRRLVFGDDLDLGWRCPDHHEP